MPSATEGQAQHLVVGVEQLLDHDALIVDAVENGDAVDLLRRAAVDVVDTHVALLAGPAAGDGQLAVGQKHHRHRPASARVNALLQLAAGGVPDGQFVMAADDDFLVVRREGQGGDGDGDRDRRRAAAAASSADAVRGAGRPPASDRASSLAPS